MLHKPTTLIEYLEYFINSQSRLVNLKNGITKSTLNTYAPRARHLINFLSVNGMKSYKPAQIKIAHIREYKIFLLSNCALGNNYSMKCLQVLDRILDIALENEDILVNPMSLFKYTYERDSTVEALEYEDIIKITYLSLNKKLSITRDLFLFSCYTGLAYVDAQKFDYEKNVINGPDKKKWIHIQRQKVGSDTYLPLLPEAEAILKHYEYKIPKKSNQKMNKGLKFIAEATGVNVELKSHVARKTFANILLNDLGVPLESISKMLGHKSVKTTEQSYAKVNLKKIASDMEGVTFSNLKNKAA